MLSRKIAPRRRRAGSRRHVSAETPAYSNVPGRSSTTSLRLWRRSRRRAGCRRTAFSFPCRWRIAIAAVGRPSLTGGLSATHRSGGALPRLPSITACTCRRMLSHAAWCAVARLRVGTRRWPPPPPARSGKERCASLFRSPRPASIPRSRPTRRPTASSRTCSTRCSTTTTSRARCKLVPRTLEAMPTVADNGATYHFPAAQGHLLHARSGVQGQAARADRRRLRLRLQAPSSIPAVQVAVALAARRQDRRRRRGAGERRARPATSTTTRRSRASRSSTATRCASASTQPDSALSRTRSRCRTWRRWRAKWSRRYGTRLRRASGRHRPVHARRVQAQRARSCSIANPGFRDDDLRARRARARRSRSRSPRRSRASACRATRASRSA